MAGWLGAMFHDGAAFGTGPAVLNRRATVSGGVVDAKRPHMGAG